MRIIKIRMILESTEEKINNFYKLRTRKSLEEAINAIQEFEHILKIKLYDEMTALHSTWIGKEIKKDEECWREEK